MAAALPDVTGYYDHHPIDEDHVLRGLAGRNGAAGRAAPEDLFPWDQDHYGGVPAVEALARRAGITAGSRVLDVCAGLGGPARFLAHRFGARVTALDLHAGRSGASVRLTRLVGLQRLVRAVQGDAQALPFAPGGFTAVVSQEGLLHVPTRRAPPMLVPGAAGASRSATGSRRPGSTTAIARGCIDGWPPSASRACRATGARWPAPASTASRPRT
jgi:SAM-dependent methyltransferase